MKFFILIPLAALLATACTPTRPTAQARVALPWSAQQLTDSLQYLLAHVVRMDTAQYHVADGVFSMRPGATVHDLTVVGKLNVLAEPDNGLPDTIHLPHDSIPHLPGGGLVGYVDARWGSAVFDKWTGFYQTPWLSRGSLQSGTPPMNVDPGIAWWVTPDGKITPPEWVNEEFSEKAKWKISKIEPRKDIPSLVAAAPVVTYTRVRPPTKKTKRHAKH